MVSLLGLVATQAHADRGLELELVASGPWVEIDWQGTAIRAEVAANPLARSRGLMARRSLAENSGMLFVFDRKARHCFWMKGTPLPLSIAFLSDDGTVLGIADMEPLSLQRHCSPQPVRYALEMDRGWFASKEIDEGSRLEHPRIFQSDTKRTQ